MKKALQHTQMNQFPIINDSIIVGGLSIPSLAERAEQTPFYAYDKQVIQNQIDQFRQYIPSRFKLHYAIKANPMPDLLDFLSSRVDGFDVSSCAEMQLAVSTKINPNTISFAGPGKTSNELGAAIAAGVTINIESEAELNRAIKEADRHNKRARIAIRINPDFELKASGMKMAGGPKPFGVDAERVPELLNVIDKLEVDFVGLHIFSGSQNLNTEYIIDAQQKTFTLIEKLAQQSPMPIKSVNIGGGFGIPYFPGEHWLDLAPIGNNLQGLLDQLPTLLSDTEFVMELGRFLVGPAGIYVTKIIERKISRGTSFLITDGGLHHHLAASGNLGQVIRKNFPVVIGNKMNASETERCSVVGRLCTPLDLLANDMTLSKADEGDFVVIYQSGAYGLTASPIKFLSHPLPVELLI